MITPVGKAVLVADVGGTHVRCGQVREGRLEHRQTVRCADFACLSAALEGYLAGPDVVERPSQAAVAVASPVGGDIVSLTNQSWSFSTAALATELRLERLEVMNDFTALALALPVLTDEQTRVVKEGQSASDAPLAVLGPGTGLGVSGLVPHGEAWVPLATEGGHRDLAAATPREWAVWVRLRRRFGHVSAERALSGPGLVHLYRALCEVDGVPAAETTPAEVAEGASGGGPAAEALRLFAAWLGAVAGDLALTLGARGGVFLGGGILPRMQRTFDAAVFAERFLDKGRFRRYLDPIPVRLILDPDAALLGAARALQD